MKSTITQEQSSSISQVGKKAMTNLVLRAKCGKWMHDICAKMKRMTSTLASSFVCKKCVEAIKTIVEPEK